MNHDVETRLRNYFVDTAERTTIASANQLIASYASRSRVTEGRQASWLRPALAMTGFAALVAAVLVALGGSPAESERAASPVGASQAPPVETAMPRDSTVEEVDSLPLQVAAPAGGDLDDVQVYGADRGGVTFADIAEPGESVVLEVPVQTLAGATSPELFIADSPQPIVDPPSAGEISISGVNQLTFAAAADFAGVAKITFTMTNGAEASPVVWAVFDQETWGTAAEPDAEPWDYLSVGGPCVLAVGDATAPDAEGRLWSLVTEGALAPQVSTGGTIDWTVSTSEPAPDSEDVVAGRGWMITATPDAGFVGEIEVRLTFAEPGGESRTATYLLRVV